MNKVIKVGNLFIGGDYPCYIIAEMSANHAGELSRALEIVHAAKESGADCIKIQTYTADTITVNCEKEFFRISDGTWKGETLYSLYKKAYTPWDWQYRIKEEAIKIGLDFLSTPFDKSAVDFLEELNVNFYKIASFELIDIPLLKYVASKGKPIILSTGMATLGEIEEAVNTIKLQGNKNLCLLKCSSAYPAIPENMNLLTIKHLAETFGIPSGLSDHSLGSIAAVAAVVVGAKVIEKHFCISRKIQNPDSSFSMEPNEFSQMVKDIRDAEKALGGVSYQITEPEERNRNFRKSIFVVQDVEKDEVFSEENIRVIRPGFGLEPKYYEYILGKKASRYIEKGTPMNWTLVY
jgi:pseudaminic acid synthase